MHRNKKVPQKKKKRNENKNCLAHVKVNMSLKLRQKQYLPHESFKKRKNEKMNISFLSDLTFPQHYSGLVPFYSPCDWKKNIYLNTCSIDGSFTKKSVCIQYLFGGAIEFYVFLKSILYVKKFIDFYILYSIYYIVHTSLYI